MGREEVVIWAGRGLLYAGKPTCRKAAPSEISSLEEIEKSLLLADKGIFFRMPGCLVVKLF